MAESYSRMVFSQGFLPDRQSIVEQMGCLFVFVLIPAWMTVRGRTTAWDRSVSHSCVERRATWQKWTNSRNHYCSYMGSFLTYRPRPGCWAWWPHQGGRVQTSSPGPPKPACKGARPPRTCPGRRTGSPGCAGFSDGLGSRSLPAGRLPRLHCCVGAALWGYGGCTHRSEVSGLSRQKTLTWLYHLLHLNEHNTVIWGNQIKGVNSISVEWHDTKLSLAFTVHQIIRLMPNQTWFPSFTANVVTENLAYSFN